MLVILLRRKELLFHFIHSFLAILSFLLTWGLIGLIQLASRSIAGQGSAAGGAH